MSTSSTSGSTLFTGSSRYATDFQQLITRAVGIASLPLTQMQSQKQAMSDESSALSSLDNLFTKLQTSVNNLSSAAASGTYAANASDTTVLTSHLNGTPLEGTYTVEVTKYGSSSTANSAAGFFKVTDPSKTSISAGSSFTLTAGGSTFTITPSANTLNALADAINAQTSANVRATIVDLGGSSAHDYRLSLQSTKLGAINLALSDSVVDTTADTEVTVRGALTFDSNAKFTLTAQDESPAVLTGATTLQDLADKINALSLTGISASLVDGQLHITKPSGKSLDLTENLLTTPPANLGTVAGYKINGSDEIQTDSRTINITDGLTADILKASGPVTVTVSRNTLGISNSIAAFVSAYNAIATEIDHHHKAEKSALAGNPILLTASSVLRNITAYTGSGTFPAAVAGYADPDSTSDIGLTMNSSGQLSFDSTRFAANTTGKMNDLLTLLGGTKTGGFLKAATDSLNSLEDSTTGLLKAAMKSVSDQMTAQDKKITDKQNQIDDLERNLQAQMAAADASVAALEQQSTYISNLFSAMSEASKAASK